MYASRATQLIVGLFAVLGIGALIYLSVRLGHVSIFPTPGYTLYANFDNISGLRNGDQVQLAGVQIGKVQSISLKENRAHVGMRINDGVEIDTDAIAAIQTSGIIGDKYIAISLGPGEHNLTDGGTIRQTQSAFILEQAIGQLINGSGSSSGTSKSPQSSAGAGQGDSEGNPSRSIGQLSGGNCNCSKQSLKN
jgi:phospholipid/cholesterol/gamma-HCH transport system substrate-binding protein